MSVSKNTKIVSHEVRTGNLNLNKMIETSGKQASALPSRSGIFPSCCGLLPTLCIRAML